MAAVLASGRGAALSHRSAAALWGLRPSARAVTEVTVEPRRRPRSGIQLHRGCLPRDEVTVLQGIPVTTVPRTLIDLAAVLGHQEVERATNEAEVRRLVDPLSLDDLIARYPRRRGVAAVKAILATGRIGSAVTRSELEDRFATFLDRLALPRPELNTSIVVGGRWFEGDFVWRSRRLIVELDGHAVHATAAAYERDRARDRTLHADGWRVVRVTWRQLHDDADALADDLRGLLGADG
jgi:hypothetical protein